MKFKCKCGFETDNIKEMMEHQLLCQKFKMDIIKNLPKHTEKESKKINIHKRKNENDEKLR